MRNVLYHFQDNRVEKDDLILDPKLDPRDPFDFYLNHYKEQLVAGYTKTTNTFGLRVFMVDYNKLHRTPRRPQPSAR